jgi:hypothetical protein
MRVFRIVTGDARGVRSVYELEAETYNTSVEGTLVVSTRVDGILTTVVCHAPGTWRSIVEVELFDAAVRKHIGTLDENSARRFAARPIQAV